MVGSAKAIYMVDRNPRMTRDEFAVRWLEHNRVGTRLGGRIMRKECTAVRYCLVTAASDVLEGASGEHDAVSLFALKGAHVIPSFNDIVARTDATYADELRTFSRPIGDRIVYTTSELLMSGPETDVVVLHFVRRKPEVMPSDFVAEWVGGQHDVLAGSGSKGTLRRCVQNLLIAPPPRGMAFDGIGEYWYDNIEDVAADGQLRQLLAAGGDGVEPNGSLLLVTKVILAPGPDSP